MDNVVYMGENFISGASDTFGANLHRHPMLEVYAACDGDSGVLANGEMMRGNVVFIGANVPHTIADRGKRGLAIFLDPLRSTGYSLQQKYLNVSRCAVLDHPSITALLSVIEGDIREVDVGRASEAVLEEFELEPVEQAFSEPVAEVIEMLQQDGASFDMEELASKACLSKSRLAHLFSEQTGITLKEYIQLKRMENACRSMVAGKSITQAAVDTGFSSSSHIASSSMKLTGLQLRRLLNL